MSITTGPTHIQWPEDDFHVIQGDLLLLHNSVPVYRFRIKGAIPGLPISELSNVFQLGLFETTEIEILRHANKEEVSSNSQILAQLISQNLLTSLRPTIDNYIDLQDVLATLHSCLLSEDKPYPYIDVADPHTDQLLLKLLEQDTLLAETPASNDSLLLCLAKHPEYSGWSLSPLKSRPSDIRTTILQTLEKNKFVGREVVINTDDLTKDCGTLLGFSERENEDFFMLLFRNGTYQVFDPTSQAFYSLDTEEGRQIIEQLTQRMYVVTKSLAQEDMSPVGLLRFAYGAPTATSLFILTGLLLGISVGFVLSIGREVGAARWIFGMAATGTLIGTTLGYLSSGFRVAVGLMFAATCLSLLTPSFNTIITNDALPDRDLGLLLQLSLILLCAGILRIAFEWIQTTYILYAQQKGSAKTDLAAVNRVLRLPIDFFRKRTVGDLQLRIGYLSDLREEIRDLLEGGLIKSVLTSIYILFMLRISLQLTFLATAISLCIAIPSVIISLQSRPLLRKQQEIEAVAQAKNLELISSVPKLRIAGAEASAARWWAQDYKRVVNLENALDIKESISSLLQSVMPNLGNLLLYIVITKLLTDAVSTPEKQLNVGNLLGFFSASATFIGSVASLSGLIVGALDLPVLYERAKPILDEPLEATADQEELSNMEGNITFDRVSYRYEASLPLVLDSLSFHIPSGGYLALVGPSGSGKSTVVRLLLGFAKPEDGVILYDGRPFSSIKPESIRQNIGAVLQTSSLFSGSIMEAIAGGALISERDAWEAAEMVGLSSDIKQMPMGLQTVIPDGGGTLSGGQCQRIAIARALVRKPKLLIFDEATSALDNKTQKVVTNTLDNLNVTRVVIAHHLSTIVNADKIVYLQDGQALESGTYQELIANKGYFYELVQRQLT